MNINQVHCKLVGWTNFCFIEDNGVLKSTRHDLKLWKEPPFYSCDDENDPPTPTDEEINLLETIISNSDVITTPTEAQKHLLWQLRHFLVANALALPKFLMAVPWSKFDCVLETHRLLRRWTPLPPFYAVQLLGPQFGDKSVRDYAVDRLRHLTEDEFHLVLIQLVQALVYEPYNKSSLLQLLLERAANWTIGHHLFWLVKTGLQVPFFKARFEFVMEELLRSCKSQYVDELIKQDDFVRTLIKIANSIKPIKSEARKGALRKMLKKLQFAEPISLPLNPTSMEEEQKQSFVLRRFKTGWCLIIAQFTPDMAYVMGGTEDERFKQFQELCGLAFNKLRENAHLFLNLVNLMVSSGIPELATPQNVCYLRDILVLDLSEEDAKLKFNEWIIESLQTTATQVNYAIHTWAHG